MKKPLYILLFILSTALTQPAQAQDDTANQGVLSAQEFVQKVGVANQFEMESSELALQRSQREDIKEFARLMITDHGAVGDSLKTAVSGAGLKVEDIPEVLDPKHAAIMTGLKAAAPEEFDQKYVRVQKDGHDEAVELFQSYMSGGDNAVLREFAAATLPTLKQHQDHIHQFTEIALGN